VADNPRIEELRRRVQKDPASIAFAQLAEEYRRNGDFEEAVRVCRTGLAKHPSYLSARVTLGRALIELEQYDEAQTELDYVLRSAPENLAAIRGLAEIHQRRGDLAEALKQYQAALAIAKHDPELEESVHELSRQVGAAPGAAPPPALPRRAAAPVMPPPIPAEAATAEIAFDLPPSRPPVPDTPAPVPAAPALSPELEAAADEFTRALEALDSLAIDLSAAPLGDDAFTVPDLKSAEAEAALSVAEQLGFADPTAAPNAEQEADALHDLENWLASIDADRDARAKS
jgi:tetratricopeptide (TPR) repeat protein